MLDIRIDSLMDKTQDIVCVCVYLCIWYLIKILFSGQRGKWSIIK